MTDYLIVGCGLAGIAFAETALNGQKSIFVIDGCIFNSSKVAAGLYSPIVLKRYTPLANAAAHIELLYAFYTALEQKLGVRFHYRLPVLRKFFSIEEQNNWFAASDKPGLSSFLSADLVKTVYSGIASPFGYGKVNQTGYVDTSVLLDSYREFLQVKGLYAADRFDYSELKINADCITYRNIKARHIVFAEGYGLHQNPFFNTLPLTGAKGELLIVKAPTLDLDVILNTNVFILPLGDDLFKIGATYNWTDKTEIPTEEARIELLGRIREIIQCDFEIVAQLAGVRPTVKDRKPLVGTHLTEPRVHILNGLGTRGVMLAPAMAHELFAHIESQRPLPREIDIRRFDGSDQ